MENNIHIELLYQREAKEEMKEDANYALNKWEITPQEYEQLTLDIIAAHKTIVDEIMRNIS